MVRRRDEVVVKKDPPPEISILESPAFIQDVMDLPDLDEFDPNKVSDLNSSTCTRFPSGNSPEPARNYKPFNRLWRIAGLIFWAPFYFCLSMPYMWYLDKRHGADMARPDRYTNPEVGKWRMSSREMMTRMMCGCPTPYDYIFYILFITPHEVYTGECYLDRGW